MKRFFLLFSLVLLGSAQLRAQNIDFSYETVKLKAAFPPIISFPAGSTFDIQLPESLLYNKGEYAVRSLWSPYGLWLDMKWDSKSTASTYLFRLNVSGMQVVGSREVMLPDWSYVREYAYRLPAQLDIIATESGEVLKTIVINPGDSILTTNFHKNFYYKDAYGQPLYNTQLGFPQMSELEKRRPDDPWILTTLEGIAATRAFERMKKYLVALYGTQTLKERLMLLQVKDNKTDYFSTIQEAIGQIIAGAEMYSTNPMQPDTYLPVLQQGQTVLENELAGYAWVDKAYMPFILHYNLAIVNLLAGKDQAALAYMQQATSDARPTMSYFGLMQENFNAIRSFLNFRNSLMQYK